MNFSDITSWAVGPAYFRRQDDEQIYIITTGSDKPLKVVLEDDSPDVDWTEAYGGPGNHALLRWSHDSAYVFGGVYSLSEEDEPDIDTSDIEQLL